MSDELGAWLVSRLGQPVPYGRCGTAASSADMVEGVLPRRVIDFGLPDVSIVVHEVVRLCPACVSFASDRSRH